MIDHVAMARELGAEALSRENKDRLWWVYAMDSDQLRAYTARVLEEAARECDKSFIDWDPNMRMAAESLAWAIRALLPADKEQKQ